MSRCEDVLGDFCEAWKSKEQVAFLLDLCPELHIEGKGRSGPLRGDAATRSIDRRAAALAVERDGFAHFTRDFVIGQKKAVDGAEETWSKQEAAEKEMPAAKKRVVEADSSDDEATALRKRIMDSSDED